MLKVAIVGIGTISYIHQWAIEECAEGELVAVCDINPSLKAKYPDLPFYENIDELLENEKLDVVHICLPHDLHVPTAEKCLKKGVHVFLEKPVGISLEESLHLTELSASYPNVKTAVSFQNRYNQTSLKLKELLTQGSPDYEVGKIKAVKGLVTWFRPKSYYEAEPWRGTWENAGGGTISNQSIHTLDLMQWFAGEDILSCQGRLMNLLDYDIEVEDTAVGRFEFEEDINGLYFATNAYEVNSSVEVEVITSRVRYLIKNNSLYLFDEEGYEGELIVEDETFPGSKSYYGLGHKHCIQSFYRAIQEDTDDYIHLKDALPSMQMIELLKQSSATERKVYLKELVK